MLALGFTAFPEIAPVPDESAPFIFSLNVFEHIDDDDAALRQIRQKLQPGGSLLLYVPAFQCLWSSLDDQVCHRRRYTKTSLRRLVERAGFSIEKLRYADSLGFVVTLVFRLSRRKFEALTPASIGLYDRWIFPPSRVLDLLFNRWFGKNVYVLCRKMIGGSALSVPERSRTGRWLETNAPEARSYALARGSGRSPGMMLYGESDPLVVAVSENGAISMLAFPLVTESGVPLGTAEPVLSAGA